MVVAITQSLNNINKYSQENHYLPLPEDMYKDSAIVNSYLHSLLPSTVKLWNRLPENLVSAQSVEHFRQLILNLPQFLTTPTTISF